ncbi:MAG: response regulator transcription factor [Geobacteraceae bacterium]|nr:response regulator transcription factor [Geobacteraceae bacterium]
MENESPVRIFIADDHPLLRMGLSLAFNAKDNIEVIGESDNGFDAIEKIKVLVPDVALLDIDMPGLSGTAAIRVLRKIFPDMKILVLSTYNDDKYIREAMSAGANGYILKTANIDNLVEIIISVKEGREIFSPYLLDLGIELNLNEAKKVEYDDFGLTKREKQILACLAGGKDNKQISVSLYLSIETVKTHMKNIFRKMNTKSRLEAVMKAKQLKLID